MRCVSTTQAGVASCTWYDHQRDAPIQASNCEHCSSMEQVSVLDTAKRIRSTTANVSTEIDVPHLDLDPRP